MWISTQQVNYWSYIRLSSNVREKIGIEWIIASTFIDFILHIFYWLYLFHGDTKLHENIIQNFPRNWIIDFLEVCKLFLNCFIVFPFLLEYLTNAEYMINSWPVASKSTLMIPSNFLCIYGVNLESRMLDKILYVIGKSDMPL